jgi:NADH-quinone oxidoreductase subunit J
MILEIIMLVALVVAALWTIMSWSLLRSAIGLALTSAILSIIIYRLNSPLAAVFELSVCPGLISVLFISTISLTEPLSREEVKEYMHQKMSRFWYLPLILIAVGVIMALAKIKVDLKLPPEEIEKDARLILWNLRHLDLMGQVIILLAGVFGVVILFKESRK